MTRRAVDESIELYGFKTFTHGAQRVLTVMSPSGPRAVAACIHHGEDVHAELHDNHLARYFEKREGALREMARHFKVKIVERDEWNALKQRFGDRIYRDA